MDKYIELLLNKKYLELSNINFIDELASIKYKGKYLIEYLLELGIHSENMDNYLVHHEEFAIYYLKYNIIKPLMNCSLAVLLKKVNGILIMDLVLNKLNDQDKIDLYYNIRKNSFNDFYYYEQDIIKIFLNHGIILPNTFVNTYNNISNDQLDDSNKLINEFLETFKDTDFKLLNFIVNELKRNLKTNHERTSLDIKKLIEFKKKYPNFKFIDTKNRGGESFDPNSLEFKINTTNSLMYNHEFSHFLYESFEDKESLLDEYEKIRSKVDTNDNIIKIKKYLSVFHQQYESSKEIFKELYYDNIRKKYKSFENYVESVYISLKDDVPSLIEIWNSETKTISYPFIMEFNFKDIVLNFLENEKNEFIYFHLREQFSSLRMLENLLDSLLMGKLFDDLEFNCLSGHGSLYFNSLKTRSFDECLANYDALKKSGNKSLINDLYELVGDELIEFLNNYIKNNREGKNEK